MKVRFQADADLKHAIVTALLRREPTIDFQTAEAAGLAGLADGQVLAIAARDGRVLVSQDYRTMPSHFGEFLRSNTSPGVLLASQGLPITVVVDELLLVWHASDSDEWVNRIVYLPL